MGHTACTEPQCLYKGALYLTFHLYRCGYNSNFSEDESDIFSSSTFTLQIHFKLATKLTLFSPEVSIPSSIRRIERYIQFPPPRNRSKRPQLPHVLGHDLMQTAVHGTCAWSPNKVDEKCFPRHNRVIELSAIICSLWYVRHALGIRLCIKYLW